MIIKVLHSETYKLKKCYLLIVPCDIYGSHLSRDTENAFDLLNHNFPIMVLEKLDFKTNFVNQIKILLCNQESCIVNGGSVTKYFKFKKSACQGDPISVYLFIIVLEVPFIFN